MERPDRLFQQHYSRKNKDTTGVPPPSLNAPLDDITMPSNDSSRLIPRYKILRLLTYESTALNPPADQSRRYPLHSCKESDMSGFLKPSSNVVYPISDFVSYHRLCKSYLGLLSYVSIPSHFQEALEDPKWNLLW